jgi:pimeloyl-ACP methyl ester carboxylesterase
MKAAEFLDIGGICIAYRSSGEGKPLVFLHGFTYSSYSFRHNIPILSKFARVICPDLIGHGKSDKPTGFDYSLKNQAELIYDFCRKLGLDRIDLGGCSMGGALAMQLAISYPDFVERLILVDSAGLDLDVKSPQRIFAIPIVGHIAALATTVRFRKSTHTRMTVRDDEVTNAELEEYVRELKSFSSLMAGVRNLRANRAFKLAGIGNISQQTLIIWGERDPLFSTDSAVKLTEIIARSRLILLPGAWHLPNEEKPADFNQVVIDFLLERIPSARGTEV